MKRYYVAWGDFANAYRVIYTESADEKPNGAFERITLKEAQRLIRREKERRRDDPSFSGYASAEIERFCPETDS